MKKVYQIVIASMVLVLLCVPLSLFAGGESESAGATAGAPERPKITWRLSHTTATDSPYHIGTTKLAEIVSERTDGNFEIVVYPNGILGWEREVLEAMQVGSIEMTLPAVSVLEMFVPSFGCVNLPFMFKSPEHMLAAFQSPAMERIKKDALQYGFVITDIFGPVLRYPMNRVRPINHPDDFKGIKFRAPGVPIFVDTYQALGANVNNTAFSELYSALQLGVVDGCENFKANLYTMKFYEVMEYLSIIPAFNNVVCYAIAEQAWNELPAEYQEILVEACAESARVMDEAFLGMESTAEQAMIKAGIKVNTPDDLTPFIEATEPIRQKALAEMEPWVADVAEEIMSMDF